LAILCTAVGTSAPPPRADPAASVFNPSILVMLAALPRTSRLMDFYEKPSIAQQNRHFTGHHTSPQSLTTREEAVEALRRAEAKYRSIVENAVEGIFQTTPDGHYLSANPALARIYGYASPQELINSIGDIERQLYVDDSRREDFIRLMEQDGVVTGFESEIHRKDGRVIWISENARAVRSSHGEIEYYEGTVVDISARKHSEVLHQEKEAAEAANRAKSQFLAHMSHELRTPLNGVIGMLDLLIETSLSQQQQRYASIARSSADLLLSLINEILDLSKIEAGKLELEHVDFELRGVLESALEMLAPKARQKGLELSLDMPPEHSLPVRGDPQRLQQIVVNLLSNAIKFTQHGHVLVRLTLEAESTEKYVVRIAVEDTGIGIPAERLNRLFRPFSQVDASTTRQFGGTGLGLAISKQLVELMRGTIGVRSQVGAGSTFWFRLPLETQHGPKTATRVTPPELSGMRILAVDDNATNREIIFRQLSSWRFRVELAPDGPTALEMMRRASSRGRQFSLALLDGEMPVIDGYELARQIQADETLRSTRLLMLTSLGTQRSDVDMAELGIAGCLTKPVRQSQLFDTIVELAAKLRQNEPRASGENGSRFDPAAQSNGKQSSAGCAAGLKPERRSQARLLLAEDNEINQLVTCEILNSSGFACDIAPNGRQAIEHVLAREYDAVLMDCQMPEMDGMTATREIRRLEAEGELKSRGYRLPIVALTANAIDGDRERCLAEGMDDYLSKPLDALKLIALLDTILSAETGRRAVAEEASSISAVTPTGHEPVNLDALTHRCMGNREFVNRILSKLADRLPSDLTRLEECICKGELALAVPQAHAIKGLAANMSADRLHCLAGELESACRANKFESASEMIFKMWQEANRCLNFIAIQSCAPATVAAG
jgi:PAS domain S-box-containing protein